MPLIHAATLDSWANLNVARDTLGEVLRKLLYSNLGLQDIFHIRFLAHEGNQLAGWDGVLDCKSTIPWIPTGQSVWELGTGNNARKKIRDDFADRKAKELPDGWNRVATTYVAVTLRKLDDFDLFLNVLKDDSPWADVKIVDAQTIEEWIENTPTVETWLQERGIGPAPNIHTLNKVWEQWSQITNPPVIENLLLAGRDQDASDLRNSLVNPGGGPIHIKSDSSEEAVAFVYSVIQSSENDLFRAQQLARSIVIRRVEDTNRFKKELEPKNLILCPPATSESLHLARYGHTVISAFGNSSQVSRIDFKLSRADRTKFSEALVKMTIASDIADIEARACGSSPSIWRVWNLLNEGDATGNVPDWAKQAHATTVIPAILLGGWSDKSEGDKEIIGLITGKTFEEYRDELHLFINTDNPLLVKVGDAWVISAPATAFALVVSYINQRQLDDFERCVHTVFQEIDPAIDIPPDERPYMGMRDVGLTHSQWLRTGLAESLLRITVLGQRLEENGVVPGGRTCQAFVDSLITGLPGLKDNRRLIQSLRDQLPVLMEAAPIPFVEALEGLLQGHPEELKPFFEEGEGIFGHAHHTSLLWGLETLVWEPNYLPRVCLILARLAKIDPGGKLINRPANSLREIFLAWHPGTNANLEDRVQVLELILDKEPDVGWKLLYDLMPEPHQISTTTNEPTWKEFGRATRRTLTNKDVWEAYTQYIDKAINQAGLIPERWNALVGLYDNLSDEHQQRIEVKLKALAESDISDEQKNGIWETLREFINRHKEFPGASWSLPPEKIERLEFILNLFKPTSPLDKNAWLFDEYFPNIPFPKDEIEKEEEELSRIRSEAIKDIWDAGEISLLREFINKVTYPGAIASFVMDFLPDITSALNLVNAMVAGTDNESIFVSCFSETAFKRLGEDWTSNLIEKAKEANWPPNIIAGLFLNYPDNLNTFELVNRLGNEVKNEYWLRRRGWASKDDDATLAKAIDEFNNHGRALVAINIAANKWGVKDASEYLPLLDSALAQLNSVNKINVSTNVGHRIRELFKWLRKQEGIDKTELARREYAYLPALTGPSKDNDLALHEVMASDPKFFIEVICDLFKPSKGYPEDYVPPDNAKIRAEFAFKLLNSWKLPPGLTHDRVLNTERLNEWVNTARSLAAECDRVDIVDQYIGKALYYIPPDPDDRLWPHAGLRQLLEDLQNINIERGLELEQSNYRGVVTKAIYEGGKQEHDLAKKWANNAHKIGLRWSRTRSMLERISASWEAHAKREDENAEKDRLKHQ